MSDGPDQEKYRPWLSYVEAYVQAYALGERLSGRSRAMASATGSALTDPGEGQRPVVVLCSPHPDDEMLTGALPLRLHREQGARVINLVMTLGSDPSRQAVRWQELQDACGVVGFECRRLPTTGGFTLKAGEQGVGWSIVVAELARLFIDVGADFIFLPHGEDQHPAHVATHRLATAALAVMTSGETTAIAVETEYWRPMAAPNLLVGLDEQDLARLLAALSCHRGEIERNPYHLTHPPRMMDTVRRGAELVNVNVVDRPGFLFGELYRVVGWRLGQGLPLTLDHGWIGPGQDLALFIRKRKAWT